MQALGEGGRTLTPPSQKSRALMAMVATSEGMARSRAWLIDHLWSTKPLDLGQTSLRQTLREIRKALGAHAATVLRIDNFTVAFDPDAIVIDDAGRGTADFLEGIDIEDPEFEEWLTLERGRFPISVPASIRIRPAPAVVPPFTFRIDPPLVMTGDPEVAAVADDLIDRVVHTIMEEGLIRIHDRRIGSVLAGTSADGSHAANLALRCSVRREGGDVSVGLALFDLGSERLAWMRGFRAPVQALSRGQDTDSWATIHHLIEAIWLEKDAFQKRMRHGEDGGDRIRAAVQDMFAVGVADLSRAEGDFRALIPAPEGGRALAWLAFLATFRIGQRYVRHETEVHAQIRDYCAKALEREPRNALVLALAGHVQSYVFGNFQRAVELFEQSLRVNYGRPLTWDLYSVLHGYIGQAEVGYRCAQYARFLGQNSPYSAYFDASCLITAGLAGRAREAIRHGEAALEGMAQFATIHRHLASNYALAGESGKAAEAVRKLRLLEPGFSIDRLREAREPGLDTQGGQLFIRGLKKAGIREVSS